MPTDTKEQTKDYIAALLEERRGAQSKSGSDDEEVAEKASERLAAIDDELARVGHEAKAPAKRAEKRPSEGKAER